MRRVLVVLGLMFLAACNARSRPIEAKLEQNPPVDPTDLTTAPADFAVTVRDLLDVRKKDKEAADKKYARKVIEVTGVVSLVGRDSEFNSQVILSEGDYFLHCSTKDKEPWAKVAPGQKITLKGRCGEALGPVFGRLEYCVFVDSGTYETITTTVSALSMEFRTRWDAADEKYGQRKYLLVTGDVGETETSDSHVVITLKGKGSLPTRCLFSDLSNEVHRTALLNSAKVGQQLRIFGRYYRTPDDRGLIALSNCYLVTGNDH